MLFDLALTHARVIASQVKGTLKAVLVNLSGIGDKLDDTSGDGSTEEPLFGQLGVVARPKAPTSAGYTEVIAAKTGDGLQPIAARDLRLNKRVNPVEGEVDVVHYNGGFLSMKDSSSGTGTTAVLYAPRLSSDAPVEAHALILDPGTEGGSVSLVHALGMALLMTPQRAVIIKNKDGDAYIEINDGGIVINGNTQVNGSMVVGNIPNAQSVVLGDTFMLWFGQVNAAIGAIKAALTTLGVGGGVVLPLATPVVSTVLKASQSP